MNTRIAVLLLSSAVLAQAAELRSNPYSAQVVGDNRAAITLMRTTDPRLEQLVFLHAIPPPGLDRSRNGFPAKDLFLTKSESLELAGFLLAVPTGALPADAKVRIESKQLTARLVTISGQTRWTLRIGDDTPWAFIGGKKAADTLGKRITARVREIKTDKIETAPTPSTGPEVSDS